MMTRSAEHRLRQLRAAPNRWTIAYHLNTHPAMRMPNAATSSHRSMIVSAALGALSVACGSPPAPGPAPLSPEPTAATPPNGEPVTQPPPAPAEEVVLTEGSPGALGSGLSLTIANSSFSSGPPPSAGISRPALAITQLTVQAAHAGKTTELYFTLPSPGVASNTQEEWEGFVVDLVDRDLVNGAWVTKFRVSRR